ARCHSEPATDLAGQQMSRRDDASHQNLSGGMAFAAKINTPTAPTAMPPRNASPIHSMLPFPSWGFWMPRGALVTARLQRLRLLARVAAVGDAPPRIFGPVARLNVPEYRASDNAVLFGHVSVPFVGFLVSAAQQFESIPQAGEILLLRLVVGIGAFGNPPVDPRFGLLKRD